MNKKVLLLVAVIVVVVLGGWVVSGKLTKDNVDPPKFEAPTTSEISMTKNGFNPSATKIKVNTVVIWRATDSTSHRVVSNPHAQHNELPGLDSKTNIGPNDTYSYKFTRVGSFHYHDEFNPTHEGIVIVE